MIAPVLFIFFKRKETTLRVLREIKKAKPSFIYISQDGPRDKKEKEAIFTLRKLVLKEIDWSCKLFTNFEEKNLSFSYHVPKAINWVFKKHDRLIYLEDDTLPNDDFFEFVDSALEFYKNDKRILGINGTNLSFKYKQDLNLTKLPIIWGCGLYKRAWQLYDFKLKKWPIVKNRFDFQKRFINKKIFYYFETWFDEIAIRRNYFTWDIQLAFTSFYYKKFFVNPRLNLVKNIGFSSGTSSFIVHYKMPLEKGRLNFKKKLEYDSYLDKKFFDHLLVGGWLRLILIRIFMRYKFVQPMAKFLVNLVNLVKFFKLC